MNIVKLTESLAVSAQITLEDVAQIAAAGYAVLINNRPDGEESAQVPSALIATAAEAAGMEYHHMPITAASFPGPDLDAISDLFDDPSHPVLAFCRSGTRCANLWVAGVADSDLASAMKVASQCGFDLGMASSFIADAAQRK
jgi:uncharacterized protein (TIGR01244 family)